MWGALVWNARDLVEGLSEGQKRKGLVNEAAFLQTLPDQVEDFVQGMNEVASVALLNGSHFATLTADASANDGAIVVDHPERFQIGQKVLVDDDDSTPVTGYVRTINTNTKTVILYDARTGGAVIDFSGVGDDMTTAQNAKCYFEGAQANSFTSLRDQLLSAANGGSANLFGQVKLNYPHLQAINVMVLL